MAITDLNKTQISSLIDIMRTVHKTSVLRITDILDRINSNPSTNLSPDDSEIIRNWRTELENLERQDNYKAGKCLANIIIENIENRSNGRPGLKKEFNIEV